VNEFCYRARVFLSEARNHGMRGVIALHCTHGFNRTGAMAVHLKQRLGWPDAMKARLPVSFSFALFPPVPNLDQSHHLSLPCSI
jgi:protein-tyrosine phosphatase